MKRIPFPIIPVAMFIAILEISLAQDVTTFGEFPSPKLKVVKIDLTQAWVATGTKVAVGDTVAIIVTGIAATNGITVPNTAYWLGPEGYGGAIAPSTSPLPGAPAYAIIGKVGINGKAFYVGRNAVFRSNVAGDLYLGNNDEIQWDNDGFFVAYIFALGKIVGVANDRSLDVAEGPRVSQNYPNPFNPSTTIEYQLPHRANVEVRISNSIGQVVRTLLDSQKEPGNYSAIWDGRDDMGSLVATGTYFYQIRAGDFVQAKKMIMLK